MIFIAKGMNAANNNLGKLNIKNVEDISQETIDVLAAYGGIYLDSQKIAVDDFLESFNDASWKSKIKYLSMPFLLPSGDTEYTLSNWGTEEKLSLYDIITGTRKGVRANPANNAFVKIQNGGIVYATSARPINAVTLGISTTDLSWKEVNVGHYGNNSGPTSGVPIYTLSWVNGCAYVTVSQIDSLNFESSEASQIGLYASNYSRSNSQFAVIANGNIVASKVPLDVELPSTISSVVTPNAGGTFTSTIPLKLYYLGYQMTNEEICELHNMLLTLLEDFGA